MTSALKPVIVIRALLASRVRVIGAGVSLLLVRWRRYCSSRRWRNKG